MWNLPASGIKLASPRLAGGFFNTKCHQGSPRKPFLINNFLSLILSHSYGITNSNIHCASFYTFLSIHSHVCACAQPCLTLCNPLGCSLPGSSIHGIFQARILEWVAMPSFRGSSWRRDWTHISCVSCIVGRFFTHWAIREAHMFT